MRIARASEEEASLGLAPLIDVVLLLLIFFLVTSSFARPEIPLDLPTAESGSAPAPESLVVSLTREGSLRIEDREASLEELAAQLGAGLPSETQLVIRADKQVIHERVVEVLDLAREHDVAKLAIAVTGGEAPAPAEAASGPGEP